MTENKRFEVKNDYYKGLILVDNLTSEIIEEDIGTGSCYNACNLLNRYDEACKMYREDALKAEKNKEVLLEENEQLKQDGEYWSKTAEARRKEIDKLKEENEQLKSSDTITDLETEIAKLKTEIDTYKAGNKTIHERLKQLDEDKEALIGFIKKEFPKSYRFILEGFE